MKVQYRIANRNGDHASITLSKDEIKLISEWFNHSL